MIVGSPAIFALESEITTAYSRPSLRGLGFFIIHIAGKSYGVPSSTSTMLACSFDGVQGRISRRGTHTAPFADEPDALKLAGAVRGALYEDEEPNTYFGMTQSEFSDLIYSREILWAPDGDEAFDDGSHVLQFDVDNRVRLIGFGRRNSNGGDFTSLTDAWLPADDFYGILIEWRQRFEQLWQSLPKVDSER